MRRKVTKKIPYTQAYRDYFAFFLYFRSNSCDTIALFYNLLLIFTQKKPSFRTTIHHTPYTIHHTPHPQFINSSIHRTPYTIHCTLILPFKGQEFIIIPNIIFLIVTFACETHEHSAAGKVLQISPETGRDE